MALVNELVSVNPDSGTRGTGPNNQSAPKNDEHARNLCNWLVDTRQHLLRREKQDAIMLHADRFECNTNQGVCARASFVRR